MFFLTPFPSAIWMICILIVCLVPQKNIDTFHLSWLPENADKIIHATLYAILAILLMIYFKKFEINKIKILILVFTACVFYGFFIEVLQHFFTTTRHFEWLDILANTAGITAGLSIYVLFKIYRTNYL